MGKPKPGQICWWCKQPITAEQVGGASRYLANSTALHWVHAKCKAEMIGKQVQHARRR